MLRKVICVTFLYRPKKGYHLEIVNPDKNLWSEIVSKCNYFFNMSLIPEFVGKCLSKEKHIQIPDNAIREKVCYCGAKRSVELFAYFNRQCKYRKFLLDCLKLKKQTQEKVVMSRL